MPQSGDRTARRRLQEALHAGGRFDKECEALFKVGDSEQAVYVPLWKGFYGQWGWRGHSEAFLKDATIAHIGTHRHQGDVGNLPYDFSITCIWFLSIFPKVRGR